MYLWHIMSSPVVSARWARTPCWLGICLHLCVCVYARSTCDSMCVFSVWEDPCVSVHVCGVCSAKRGGDAVAGRETRDAVWWVERLKESSLGSRLLCLSESPSPAVLLVDDHVHFPGSVFCDPPMRHQQTDTCMRYTKTDQPIARHTHTWHTHLHGCQVS